MISRLERERLMSRPPSFPLVERRRDSRSGRADRLNVFENCHSLPRNPARPVLRGCRTSRAREMKMDDGGTTGTIAESGVVTTGGMM